jgi:2-polyprenyl-3-methyl-5-hydroxy-6-metoxy-1,4-benzoquinol methylase
VPQPKDIVRVGYDAVSRRYRGDHDAPPEYEPWLELLRSRLPLRADVLDLGCGCGVPMSQQLARLGHSVLGVDVSRVQIERARILVPEAGFMQADAGNLQFEANSFDAVICLYVLIHLPEDEQRHLVSAIASWLRPGALLVATVGVRAWTGEESDWLGGGARMWWSNPGSDIYRKWLVSAGLTIEHEDFVPEGSGGHQVFVASAT